MTAPGDDAAQLDGTALPGGAKQRSEHPDIVMARWMRDRERRERTRDEIRTKGLTKDRKWLEKLGNAQAARNLALF